MNTMNTMNPKIVQMLRILPKRLPKEIYSCHDGLYPVCLCVEYLDFGKKEHRNHYKNCFITSLKDNVIKSTTPN